MTTDEEREIVLQQNEALRAHGDSVFQRLRRCCICLERSCANRAACRATFEPWAAKIWDAAAQRTLERRGKNLVGGTIVFSD